MALPLTHTLAYPRIGEKRELKFATEAFWQGKISITELEATAKELRRTHWLAQQKAGIDLIPSNDFSYYDQILDMSCLVGNIPARFNWPGGQVDLTTRFAVARGVRSGSDAGTFASEMTKWFDTNYHFIVPEFHAQSTFALASSKPFDEFAEALALGIKTKPVLIGPVTYLSLGKEQHQVPALEGTTAFSRFDLLDKLLPVYVEILQRFASLGVEWVQLDEPIFALDLSTRQLECLRTAYATLTSAVPSLKLLVANYFGGVGEALHDFAALPVHALHVDLVRGASELEPVLNALRDRSTILSLGVVDARAIWRCDFAAVRPLIDTALSALGPARVWIAPASSLQHVPVTLRLETALDAELRSWLAFAEEKLTELVHLRDLAANRLEPELLKLNEAAIASYRTSPRIHVSAVAARLRSVTPAQLERAAKFPVRQAEQHARLKLPAFPTTTIGSFPQTAEVRAWRARFLKGELSLDEYELKLREATAQCIAFQEGVGLDMLVHGEFERTDMVEYFGEHLNGFAVTQFGWVQSYGSRCVKPPLIYGDVSRTGPITVRWAAYAQSLTQRPLKGMLTGPVTILQWSFVRTDQPRKDTSDQIALALRDEVLDLEAAGIAAIQIDEPALREGLPLRRTEWAAYLTWAVNSFRLAAAGVRNDTQVHTHMCYSEFNDIIEAIAALDADVITIETSRSNMELLDAFVSFQYPAEIGPGVYDIHSPRIPTLEEMIQLLKKAEAVLPPSNIWVNPDCGLKTRQWEQVRPALERLVEAARNRRAAHAQSQ